MSDLDLHPSEPVLPEHSLINNSAPVLELSAGLRSRVLADCQLHIAKAAKVRRLKWLGATATVLALLLLMLRFDPGSPAQPVAKDPKPVVTPSAPQSPGMLPGTSPGQMAIDRVKPDSGPSAPQAMEQMIEQLERRGMKL